MHASKFELGDKVDVLEGLFRGEKGVVIDIEPGEFGLVTARVFVASQDRWTRQPYADSDLKLAWRLVDGAYVDVRGGC
jgi:ribosomal protein L24